MNIVSIQLYSFLNYIILEAKAICDEKKRSGLNQVVVRHDVMNMSDDRTRHKLF